MQTARYLISAAAEFTAGMEYRKYNGNCGQTGFFLNTDRDTSSVIAHADNVALQYFNLDMVAKARERLVD